VNQINKNKIIYVIPGLGCTHHLFQYTKIIGHELKVLEWPLPKRQYTLAQYAQQFLKQIDASEPIQLMGVSFGGMICAELALLIPTQKVILISSCQNKNELPFPIKLLKYIPLHLACPEWLIRKLAFNTRWILGFMREFVPHFQEMILKMPKNYFRYAIHYIVNWNQIKQNDKLIRIHGTNDKLLWYGKISNVTFTINEGSHAMVLYQAEQVNSCLEKICNA
jgi:pimeloyl-ACP methyl ester carboxylesterase